MSSQLFSRAMKRALHRAHRQSRNFANLVVVKFLFVTQSDDFAVLGPESRNRGLQYGGELRALGKNGGRRRLRVRKLACPLAIVRRLLERLRIERTFPQLVNRDVMRNGEEPRRKFPLGI